MEHTLHAIQGFFTSKASHLRYLLAKHSDDRRQLVSGTLVAPHPLDVRTAAQQLVAYSRDDHRANARKIHVFERCTDSLGHLGIRIEDMDRMEIGHGLETFGEGLQGLFHSVSSEYHVDGPRMCKFTGKIQTGCQHFRFTAFW